MSAPPPDGSDGDLEIEVAEEPAEGAELVEPVAEPPRPRAHLLAFAAGKRHYAVEVIERKKKTPEERRQQWEVLATLFGVFAHRRSEIGIFIDRGYGAQATFTRQLAERAPASLTYRYEVTRVEAGDIYFCTNYGVSAFVPSSVPTFVGNPGFAGYAGYFPGYASYAGYVPRFLNRLRRVRRVKNTNGASRKTASRARHPS